MKINKIICDCCKKEVNIEKESGLALFEFYKIEKKISLDPTKIDELRMNQNDELVKTSLDFCSKCAEDIIKFVKDKENKKVV